MARKILVYFGSGVAVDLLITLYYLALSQHLRFLASGLGAFITLVTFVIFNRVIKNWDWKLVISYAVGTGIGTFMGTVIL